MTGEPTIPTPPLPITPVSSSLPPQPPPVPVQTAPSVMPSPIQSAPLSPALTASNGYKAAIIATVINIVLTFIFSHSYSINLLVSGIYLGFSKTVGSKTKLVFFVLNAIFLFLDSAIFKHGLSGRGGDMIEGIFVDTVGSVILAAIPVGIMLLIRKTRKV